MSTDNNYILKNPVLKPDEDFATLRAAGLQYIQNLGSDLWTDYNEHDPGITILEALCYSITELGYRTSLPMEDLLASPDGTISASQTFFTAKKILTQSPLTTDDYRKLLIDLPGVQNAWLFHCKNSAGSLSPEPPIYVDCKESSLVYTPVYQTDKQLYLKGLYNVILDLDTDPQLGDLNNGDIEVDTFISGSTPGNVSFVISFPNWKDADASIAAINLNPAPSFQFTTVTYDETQKTLTLQFTINNITTTTYSLNNCSVTIGLVPSGFSLQTYLAASGNTILTQIVTNYIAKIQKAEKIVQSANNTLLRHRNLCEDFVSLSTVQDENIGFCFDVDVTPGADIDTVLANIYLAIDNYLDPPVNFYLLAEMLAKGYTIDEIFDGPKLKHGFINTPELEASKLVSTIYASEIISLIMGISGVTGVRNFLMTGYDSNGPISGQTSQPWCLTVNNWQKAVLSEDHTKITFYKNNIPYFANEINANQLFKQLLSQQERNKLTSTAEDLKVPTGKHFSLDEYTSIQYLFPKVYGIGQNSLSPSETDARKAQARQLKGYLLFYDQLLADFLSQLKNAENLFSTDNIVQTYYAQFVNEFKDYDSIYTKDISGYLFNDNVISNQVSFTPSSSISSEWQNLYESNEKFIDRRNRFLDHLMARFAESFNDYVFLMYSLTETTQQQTEIDPTDVISNKIEFLKNYPEMSYDRAKGYNYCPLDNNFLPEPSKLWNTDNVSGLEKRLCLFGGLKDPSLIDSTNYSGVYSYTRRFLRCMGANEANLQIQVTPSGTGNIYSFTITGSQGTFHSTAPSANISDLYTDLSGQLIANNWLNDCLVNNDYVNEGMYLIEHILLRPRKNTFKTAVVCLDKNCQSCGDDDPYSFRISVVMPYWAAHFNNLAFRDYFENLARTQAPAHCMLKVCWINRDAMLEFEIYYNIWIIAMAAYYADTTNANNLIFLQDANDNLLLTLESLYSEYPTATLHDCKESTETNPVVLGKTILGTINP